MSTDPVVVAPAVVTWRVLPARTPHVLRGCPRCGPMPFASSGRFRVNASGRRLDVWLVYRCTGCDHPWNLTIRERATPQALGRELLDAYHRNDREEAWRCAFDAGLLRRAGARLEAETPVRVERGAHPPLPFTIRFELPYPLRVRLDRLLALELGVPRSRLSARSSAEVHQGGSVRDGLMVTLQYPTGPGTPGEGGEVGLVEICDGRSTRCMTASRPHTEGDGK